MRKEIPVFMKVRDPQGGSRGTFSGVRRSPATSGKSTRFHQDGDEFLRLPVSIERIDVTFGPWARETREKPFDSIKASLIMSSRYRRGPLVGIKYSSAIVKHSTRGYNCLQMTLLMTTGRCIYFTARVHSRRYNLYFLRRLRGRARKIRRSVSPGSEARDR